MPSFWAKCDIVTPPTEKWAFFRTFSRAPPPGGDTWEILLANYKGRPMPFHYLYNWLLPLARFRKSRPQGKRRWKKRKSTLPKYTSRADRPAGLSRRRRTTNQTTNSYIISKQLPTALQSRWLLMRWVITAVVKTPFDNSIIVKYADDNDSLALPIWKYSGCSVWKRSNTAQHFLDRPTSTENTDVVWNVK